MGNTQPTANPNQPTPPNTDKPLSLRSTYPLLAQHTFKTSVPQLGPKMTSPPAKLVSPPPKKAQSAVPVPVPRQDAVVKELTAKLTALKAES
jgi:hypothetical protein